MALIVVIATMATMSILTTVMLLSIRGELDRGLADRNADTAGFLADAGVQKAIAEIASGHTAYRGESRTALGGGEYSVRVTTAGGDGTYVVESVGAVMDGDRVIHRETVTATVRLGAGGRVQWRRSGPGERGT